MTAPAPGPAPAQPAPAPAQQARPADSATRAHALEADAQAFARTDLFTWYDAVTALNTAYVGQSADLIIRRWMELHQTQVQLAAIVEQQASFGSMLFGEGAAPASAQPEVDRASAAVDVGRRTIGNVVTLQDFGGQPVLGHYQTFPVPADPTPYVDNERNKAVDAITVVSQLITVLAQAQGKLDAAGSDQVAALFAQLRDQMSFEFAMHALARWNLEKTVWTAVGAGRAALLATHKQLQEQASVNRDGRDADATPEILEQMEKDADELDVAVQRLIVSDDHVNRILDHYKTERQREIFFKLLERRNLLDAILHRADKKHVETELHATQGFEKREYNASFNTSRSFGEQAEYVAVEAAKQAPGALCHFASGVFKGLSKIPLIGGVFGRSAAAFSDLGDAADLETGAWNDKTARAWRNGFAETAGVIDGALLQWGAGGELKAAEAGGAAVETYEAAKTAVDAKQIADEILKVADSFAEAKLVYKGIWASLDLIPQLQNAIASGDPAMVADAVSACFDQLISQWGGDVTSDHTAAGHRTNARRGEAQGAREDHTAALADFRDYLYVKSTGGIVPPDELQAKADMVRATSTVQKTLEAGPGKGTITQSINEKVRGWMLAAAAAALKLIKNVVVKLVEQQFAPVPKRPKPANVREWIVKEVIATEGPTVKFIETVLEGSVTGAVTAAIGKAFPQAPQSVVQAGLGRLIQMLSEALGGKDLIATAVEHVADDVAVLLVDHPTAHVPDARLPGSPS